MEASDNTATHGGQRLQHIVDSFAAKFVWLVAKTIVTTFIAGSIGLAATYVKDIRDDVKAGAIRMEALEHKQDGAKAQQDLTVQRVNNLERVSDQTVLTLRQMGEQLSRDHDDINKLQSGRKR